MKKYRRLSSSLFILLLLFSNLRAQETFISEEGVSLRNMSFNSEGNLNFFGNTEHSDLGDVGSWVILDKDLSKLEGYYFPTGQDWWTSLQNGFEVGQSNMLLISHEGKNLSGDRRVRFITTTKDAKTIVATDFKKEGEFLGINYYATRRFKDEIISVVGVKWDYSPENVSFLTTTLDGEVISDETILFNSGYDMRSFYNFQIEESGRRILLFSAEFDFSGEDNNYIGIFNSNGSKSSIIKTEAEIMQLSKIKDGSYIAIGTIRKPINGDWKYFGYVGMLDENFNELKSFHFQSSEDNDYLLFKKLYHKGGDHFIVGGSEKGQSGRLKMIFFEMDSDSTIYWNHEKEIGEVNLSLNEMLYDNASQMIYAGGIVEHSNSTKKNQAIVYSFEDPGPIIVEDPELIPENSWVKITTNFTEDELSIEFINEDINLLRQVQIFSVDGKLIHQTKVNETFVNYNSNLSQGIYFVRVQEGENLLTQKIYWGNSNQ